MSGKEVKCVIKFRHGKNRKFIFPLLNALLSEAHNDGVRDGGEGRSVVYKWNKNCQKEAKLKEKKK